MGVYGCIAVMAAKNVNNGMDPKDAWEIAYDKKYDRSSPSWGKGCPKGAFLGLYGGTGVNANYARAGLEYLRDNPDSNISASKLWDVLRTNYPNLDLPLTHNGQMDVVLSLYREGLIKQTEQLLLIGLSLSEARNGKI